MVLCLGLTSAASLVGAVKQFRAGAATSNITPWLGLSINGGMQDRTATHIHDELHARCLVLDDGRTQIAIVVVDSCMVPRETFDAAKHMLHEQSKSGLIPRLLSCHLPAGLETVASTS